MDTDEFLLYIDDLAEKAAKVHREREAGRLAPFRRWWTGKPYGCLRPCRWDNPREATRVCLDCQRVEVMSHL